MSDGIDIGRKNDSNTYMLEPLIGISYLYECYNPVNEISPKQKGVEFIFPATVSIVKQYGEEKTGSAFKQ